MGQLASAGDDQEAVALLDGGHALGQVAFQQGGVPRQRLAQGPGGDVLGHAVQPVRERAQGRVVRQLRPDRGQALVGLAAQHHRVSHQELLERDLVAVGVQHQPPIGRGHRRLEGAVHGHGVVDDQSSHPGPPCRRAGWVTRRRRYEHTRRNLSRPGDHSRVDLRSKRQPRGLTDTAASSPALLGGSVARCSAHRVGVKFPAARPSPAELDPGTG
jgi:hypothetical protein